MARPATLIATLMLAAMAAGQQPVVPVPGETVEVEITNLDVIVTDREGKHVHGLTKEDFEILEDGRRQPVTHFAEYKLGARGADEKERVPRSLLFFVEITRLPNFRVEPFIAAMKSLVRSTITQSDDRAAIVTFTDRATMRIAPTGDIAAIERTFDAIASEFLGVRHDEIGGVARQMSELREFERQGAEEAGARQIDRPATSARSLTASASSLSVIQAERTMKRRLAAVTAAVHALAGVEGKKTLVLATHRMGQLIGAEFVVATGGPGNAVDNRYEVAKLVANANAAGVTVYPVYPAGLDQTPDNGAADIGPQILANEMASLEDIAAKTGGLSTYGTTNIANLLPRVAADIVNYYSLAYRATDDAAHEVQVRVNDGNYDVRARRQVIERSEAGRMRDRLLAALHDSLLYSPVHVSATKGDAKKVGRKLAIPLRLTVPIRELTLLPAGDGHAGAFTVYLMSGASYGEASAMTEETRRVEVPAAKLAAYRRGDLTYEVELQVDPDADRVAIGVLDQVGKTYGVTTLSLESSKRQSDR